MSGVRCYVRWKLTQLVLIKSIVLHYTMTMFSKAGPSENDRDVESGEHRPNEEPVGLPGGC